MILGRTVNTAQDDPALKPKPNYTLTIKVGRATALQPSALMYLLTRQRHECLQLNELCITSAQ